MKTRRAMTRQDAQRRKQQLKRARRKKYQRYLVAQNLMWRAADRRILHMRGRAR